MRLSATRLNEFLECPHKVALWLAGETAPAAGDMEALVRQRGFEHETRTLDALEAIHGRAAVVSDQDDFDGRAAETRAAMSEGRPLIYQGVLRNARWVGAPDFLVRALPPGARVGTVDKFQGQEAVAVIVSMATSHGADAPRGTDFLFSPNRLNVALSRAQCLAILVRGRALLDMSPSRINDLQRLDAFARVDSRTA